MNDSSESPLRRLDLAVVLLLVLLPIGLAIQPLVAGAIPYSMDSVTYFFPLRWHVAELARSGHWPLWNRTIMGGMPLWPNPQSAILYPLNWPMTAWPGGLLYTLPIVAQIGLWAAFTFLALRVARIGRAAALWAGLLLIAGNYGWSRLQYGNYMNVPPWWALWLAAALLFADRRQGRWLGVGALSAALAILAGAQPMAVYGAVGHGALTLWMVLTDSGHRARWLIFAFATAAVAVLFAAPGWLPTLAFLQETSRAGGVEAETLLRGSFADFPALLRSLIDPSGDAENAGAVGLVALIASGLVPLDRGRRRLWFGCWLAAALTLAPTLAPVVERIAFLPGFDAFHDPRRMLGFGHWALVLAAAIAASDWFRRWDRGRGWRLPAMLPAAALAASAALLLDWSEHAIRTAAWVVVALVVLAPAAADLFAPRRRPAEDEAFDDVRPAPGPLWRPLTLLLLALAATGILGWGTWTSTSFDFVPATALFEQNGRPPLLVRGDLAPGERFFSLDWKPDTSYDYRRPDLVASAVPNLSMLWGVEDLGGYEPIKSTRYEEWLKRVTQWPQGIQPWERHFGLVYPPYPQSAQWSEFQKANVRVAVLPRWGFPVYMHPAGDGTMIGPAPAWPAELNVRAVYARESARPTTAVLGWLLAPPDHQSVPLAWADLLPGIGAVPIAPDTVSDAEPAVDADASANANIDIDAEPIAEAAPPSATDEPTAETPPPTPPDEPAGTLNPSIRARLVTLRAADPTSLPEVGPHLLGFQWRPDPLDTVVGAYLWSDRLGAAFPPIQADELVMLTRIRPLAASDAASSQTWATVFPADPADPADPAAGGLGEILSSEIEPNRLRVEVEWTGPGPGIVEIHDAHWRGWSATVNGQPAPVLPSGEYGEGLWRWIEIEPGRSVIEMIYRPPLFGLSLLLAAFGLIVGSALTITVSPPPPPDEDEIVSVSLVQHSD